MSNIQHHLEHFQGHLAEYIRHSEEIKKEIEDKIYEEKLEALTRMQDQLREIQEHQQQHESEEMLELAELIEAIESLLHDHHQQFETLLQQHEQLHNYLEAQHLTHKNLAQAHQNLRLHL